MHKTNDLRVQSTMPLATPDEIKAELPLDESVAAKVARARSSIEDIVQGRDARLLVIVGPCSIHDPAAALEYAAQLQTSAARYSDSLLLCMRGYFEKPRTSVGWKGFVNDPHLDGSCDVPFGLRAARKLLLALAELGLPIANEALDPVTPQYLADLIAWSAVGARTTESQTHREMASGLSMPVGFKNGTDGSLEIAINAMQAAAAPHSFLGIDGAGRVSVIRTAGNPYGHVVLRGGSQGPNYSEAAIAAAAAKLRAADQNPRMVVDCSHGNSQKDYARQPSVAADIAQQIERGSFAVLGVMLESHLVAGRQDLRPGCPLTYGQSITDGCIDFAATEGVLEGLAFAVQTRGRRAA
ncbi:MAG: 3-deoxy-D-arabinoheptulosonate-7-phosphate synthase [Pseudomonadota bacterium]|jgi:3-deoxy-7-phosphoheptulonate synthase